MGARSIRKGKVMKSSSTVFVLADKSQNLLLEKLFDIGYVPIVREKMHKALDIIRHENFAAVLIDRDTADVDILEFILNVRDIKEDIPVIIIGDLFSQPQKYRAVLKQEHTFFVNKSSNQLGHVLQDILRH